MSTDGLPRVLCVDDEPRVLEGLETTLSWDYDCHLAEGGEDGLQALRACGPFAVVISDMRMPGMDGATFLAAAQKAAPDTVRMLLTGYSDMDAAVSAINKGNIFRFLHKPCGPDILLPAVEAAVKQHQLIMAERDLLENTLSASIKVLTDVLNLAAPVAFNRAIHLKGYVSHIANELKVQDVWQLEVAAMLSHIGCITIPSDTLERKRTGLPLSKDEQHMFASHPGVGFDLLARVPRLEIVAEIIRRQHDPITEVTTEPKTDEDRVTLGIALLQVALEADQAIGMGASMRDTIAQMKKKSKAPPKLVNALEGYEPTCSGTVVRFVRIKELTPIMILADDVITKTGSIVVAKGHPIDRVLIRRLQNFAGGSGIVEPLRVTVPRS